MPNLRDPDGAYMAFSAIAIAYAYNTNLVRAEDVPKSALDFLKPVFSGKLISVYPHDDDAALYLFHLIVQKYGWNWMDRYMANKPNFIQGHLPVARTIAEGKNAATLDATSTAWPLKRAGPADRGRVLGRVTSRRCSRSPAASSRMRRIRTPPSCIATWYPGQGAAGRLGTFSPRIDVPPPEGFRPLTSYKIANAYREFITDEKLDCRPAQAHGELHRPDRQSGRRAVDDASLNPSHNALSPPLSNM